jgi:hypothetical protein
MAPPTPWGRWWGPGIGVATGFKKDGAIQFCTLRRELVITACRPTKRRLRYIRQAAWGMKRPRLREGRKRGEGRGTYSFAAVLTCSVRRGRS